jgi:hypothetical protein
MILSPDIGDRAFDYDLGPEIEVKKSILSAITSVVSAGTLIGLSQTNVGYI